MCVLLKNKILMISLLILSIVYLFLSISVNYLNIICNVYETLIKNELSYCADLIYKMEIKNNDSDIFTSNYERFSIESKSTNSEIVDSYYYKTINVVIKIHL